MNPFSENLALPKATNKDRFSLGSQDSTYNTSDSDPSLDSDPFVDSNAPPDCSRARLSLLVKAMKIGKMVPTGDSTATSSTSPNNVRGGESPASFLVGNSDHSTPEVSPRSLYNTQYNQVQILTLHFVEYRRCYHKHQPRTWYCTWGKYTPLNFWSGILANSGFAG